jgi:hypothetical protein
MAAVPRIKRGFQQRNGRWIVGQCVLGQIGLRARAIRRRDAGSDDPPLSRYLRDSGLQPLTPSVRTSRLRAVRLSRDPCPSRSLVPERFRGPVAPSAAGCGPRLSRGGCLGRRHHALVRGAMPGIYTVPGQVDRCPPVEPI